ncbi:sulfurtransferase [Aquipuribacter sp. SD81]|uniref:sulfurtransferase n=1 Tax=Aquipuribacter sp. SD81 TaxID=3127703 RepID=UPI00301A2E0D
MTPSAHGGGAGDPSGSRLPPVVGPGDLAGVEPPPVLVDVRWYLDGRSGADAHAAGHLPGAVFLDLDRWLAAPAGGGGRHPLPDPGTFTEGLAAAGIGDDDHVVAYDDAGGAVAARLVWLLRVTGRSAALLDGGLRSWTGPLQSGSVERARTAPQVRPWPPAAVADAAAAAGSGTVLLDARASERYRGDVEPVDPRAGHVPGARNLPATDLLDDDGRLLPVERLAAAFTGVGAGADADVVASCGSGVTACLLLVAREHAGLPPGRLWPGSFSEWSRDPANQVVTGPSPSA